MPRQETEDIDLAGDSELSPELLLWRGNVTRTPSPLPVREPLVYDVSNHEVMDCPEHQNRLSKGVIAKFVQLFDFQTLKSHRGGFISSRKRNTAGGFCFLY
jgi:hypothetical protein